MLKEQQEGEIEVSHSDNKLMVDENVPGETETQEKLSFHDTFIELLPEDESNLTETKLSDVFLVI